MKYTIAISIMTLVPLASCQSGDTQPQIERTNPNSVITQADVKAPSNIFVVLAINGKTARSYEPVNKRFSDWRSNSEVSEIRELQLYNDEIEYRLMDEFESNYITKVRRYLSTTPYKIVTRSTFTFSTYKEAALKRRELLEQVANEK